MLNEETSTEWLMVLMLLMCVCVLGWKVMAPKGLLLSGDEDDDSDEGSEVQSRRDSDERVDADVHVCVVCFG